MDVKPEEAKPDSKPGPGTQAEGDFDAVLADAKADVDSPSEPGAGAEPKAEPAGPVVPRVSTEAKPDSKPELGTQPEGSVVPVLAEAKAGAGSPPRQAVPEVDPKANQTTLEVVFLATENQQALGVENFGFQGKSSLCQVQEGVECYSAGSQSRIYAKKGQGPGTKFNAHIHLERSHLTIPRTDLTSDSWGFRHILALIYASKFKVCDDSRMIALGGAYPMHGLGNGIVVVHGILETNSQEFKTALKNHPLLVVGSILDCDKEEDSGPSYEVLTHNGPGEQSIFLLSTGSLEVQPLDDTKIMEMTKMNQLQLSQVGQEQHNKAVDALSNLHISLWKIAAMSNGKASHFLAPQCLHPELPKTKRLIFQPKTGVLPWRMVPVNLLSLMHKMVRW